MADARTTRRRAIRDGLFSGDIADVATLRLQGSRCPACGETAFGRRTHCPQCSHAPLEYLPLGAYGTLWTFTIVRHRPPGDYRGPEPFEPFGLGLVEVAEGVRVMSPIRCEPGALRIGLSLTFVPYVRADPDGSEVVVFAFEPVAGGGAHV